MNQMVKIPKAEYEKLLQMKSAFDAVASVLIQHGKTSASPALNWDNLPEEDISLYKPSFLRGLRQAQKEAAAGKGKRISSLRDL